MTCYNKLNTKNALDAMKEYYTDETMDTYSDIFHALHTLRSVGVLSYEEWDKVVRLDEKLFETSNAE